MLVVARRQTAVARSEAAAKGVRRHVQSPGVEIESDSGCGESAEVPLCVDGILSRQNGTVGARFGIGDCRDEFDQVRPQRIEQLGDSGGRCPRFELVEQGVVGDSLGEPDCLGLFALERDDLFQPRQERPKVRILPCRHPRLL